LQNSPTWGGDIAAAAADLQEKDKYKNMTSFGCGAQRPLALEQRKDIFLALTNTLDPQMSPGSLAVAAWSAEVTMGAFWLLTHRAKDTIAMVER
jgi:hypothetical protein